MPRTNNYSFQQPSGKAFRQQQRYETRQAQKWAAKCEKGGPKTASRAEDMENLASKIKGGQSDFFPLQAGRKSVNGQMQATRIERPKALRHKPLRHRARQENGVNKSALLLLFLITLSAVAPVAAAAERASSRESNLRPSIGYNARNTLASSSEARLLGASMPETCEPPRLVPFEVVGLTSAPKEKCYAVDFEEAENRPGFGEGDLDPSSYWDTLSRKLGGQLSEIRRPEVPKVFSEGAGFVDDTAVFVTKDAQETTNLRFEMIRAAKQSIELSGNFGGGKVFLQTLEEIRSAMGANKNLKVHLLFSNDFITAEEKGALDSLKIAFEDRLSYLITGRKFVLPMGTYENHVKLTVIDGKYAMVGGTGVTDNFVTVGTETPPEKEKKTLAEHLIPTAARDQDNIFRGSLAKKARGEFFKLLKKWEKIETQKEAPLRWFHVESKGVAHIPAIDASPRLDRGVKVKLLTCGPEQQVNPCTQAIEKLILHGTEELILAHMYQNYVREVDAALEEMVGHGKKITIITNKYWGNSPARNVVMCSTFDKLEGPKVSTYHFDVPETLYHKKIVVSKGEDETCYSNGSYNLGKKSHSGDDEILAIFCKTNTYESPAAATVMEEIERDIHLSVKDEEAAGDVYDLSATAEKVDSVALQERHKNASDYKRSGGVWGALRWLSSLALSNSPEMLGSYTV